MSSCIYTFMPILNFTLSISLMSIPRKVNLFSLCMPSLPKILWHCFQDLLIHIVLHMWNLIVINVPIKCILLSVYHIIYYTYNVWVQYLYHHLYHFPHISRYHIHCHCHYLHNICHVHIMSCSHLDLLDRIYLALLEHHPQQPTANYVSGTDFLHSFERELGTKRFS